MAIIGNQTNLNITPANSGMTYSHSTTISASSGNNTIYADYQDVNFALLGSMNTSAAISNVTLTLGPNSLNFGNGNNVVYGDLRDITMSINGGGASDGGFYSNFMDNDTISMAGNTIVGGNGSNVVYGNMRDLTLTVGGNIASNGSVSVNEFISDNFTFGGNSITLGSGNNTVYGVMRNLTLISTGSEADDLNSLSIAGVGDMLHGFPWVPGDIQPVSFTMFGNTITVGNGSNTIYGDLQTLNLIVSGGVSSSTVTPPDASSTLFPASDDEVSFFDMTLGNNTINAGSGKNTVYGSVGDVSISTTGGVVNGAQTVGEYVELAVITMGFNNITVGDGLNVIYGDMHNLTINIAGGTGNGLDPTDGAASEQNGLFGDVIVLGSNQIQAGNGNNTIYGTLNDLSIFGHDSQNASITLTVTPPVFMGINDFIMGSNQITTGNGNDTIYGVMHDLNIFVKGGTATGTSLYDPAPFRNDSFTLGNNTISAGNGADVVYGDLHEINWSATGGSANGAGSLTFGTLYQIDVNLGHNSIDVGAGNDIVFGNMEQLSLAVKGGQITNGAVDSYNTVTQAYGTILGCIFDMEGNIIHGDGGNDILFGNLETLNFSAQAGTLVSGIGDVSARFSGDVHVPTGPTTFVTKFDTGDTIAFGSDMIDAGDGNDVLVGDALNLTGLDTFLVSHPTNYPNINFIDWGNDVMMGGAGNDKFVESLDTHTGSMFMQGADIITDFTMGKDILAMGYVLGANGNAVHDAIILDNAAVFVNFMVNGEKELAAIFHSAGADANLASQYQTAIQNFVNADVSAHPTETNLQILQDVAQFIYQSATATASTGAGDMRDSSSHVILPATGITLASQVNVNDAPLGAVILESHSTSQSGFSSFTDMANHHALVSSATAIVV